MRRKPRVASFGLEFAPPPKKSKSTKCLHGDGPLEDGLVTLDATSYERHLAMLTKELKKGIRNKGSLKSLMRETAPNRRQWILEKRPLVPEVVKTFPPLKEYDFVSCLHPSFFHLHNFLHYARKS